VRDAPQRGLDAADDDRHTGERLTAEIGVGDGGAVGPLVRAPTGRILILAARLLLRRELVEHRVEVARGDAHHETWPTEAQQVLGRTPVGLRDHADAKSARFEEATDERRAEGGMIDVGVAIHQQDVELVPAARTHLFRARRQECAELTTVLAKLREGHGSPEG